MIGKIIWWVTSFGCAALFYGIGIYAGRRKKPMWFWSGSQVEEGEITDIPAYNCANSRMWKSYSLWYVAAGVAEIWSSILALIFLCLGCTLGIGILVGSYGKIYQQYKAE